MRVLMISKACVVGTYQRKLEEIAKLGVDLTVVVPQSWHDPSGELKLELAYTQGYRLLVEPIQFNGNYHLHAWPTLARRMAEIKPDLVHIDEEPYNRAAWQALRLARQHEARSLFFSWQNLVRRYPPPFSWGERWTLKTVDWAIMGTESAAQVWRAKGYDKGLTVIPQFGIDPAFFQPAPDSHPEHASALQIGYAGRLVPEKGVHLILKAVAELSIPYQLSIAGQGRERERLERLAAELGIQAHVTFIGQMPSTQLPRFYQSLDMLVVPSLSQPNWTEQFGRVILEANACGVPVIGSDCGAIPGLIRGGGLVVPENDVDALRAAIGRLGADPALRATLSAAGRRQVMDEYTHAQVAAQTVDVYWALL